MTMTLTEYNTLGRQDPKKAVALWEKGEPIRFTQPDFAKAIRRLTAVKLDSKAYDAFKKHSATLYQGKGEIVLDRDFLSQFQNDVTPPKDAEPPVVAYMTGLELLVAAATVAALGIALGILAEGATDDDTGSGGVTATHTGNGDIVVNNND